MAIPDSSTPPSAAQEPVHPVTELLTTWRDRRGHVVARRATVIAGVACSLVAWLVAGVDGLASGAIATLLVVLFFWSGTLPLYVARRGESGATVGLGMLILTFSLRIALAFLILRLSQHWEFVDSQWLGVTIIASALTWTAVHTGVALFRR